MRYTHFKPMALRPTGKWASSQVLFSSMDVVRFLSDVVRFLCREQALVGHLPYSLMFCLVENIGEAPVQYRSGVNVAPIIMRGRGSPTHLPHCSRRARLGL